MIAVTNNTIQDQGTTHQQGVGLATKKRNVLISIQSSTTNIAYVWIKKLGAETKSWENRNKNARGLPP